MISNEDLCIVELLNQYDQGLTSGEIAQQLGKKPGNIRPKLSTLHQLGITRKLGTKNKEGTKRVVYVWGAVPLEEAAERIESFLSGKVSATAADPDASPDSQLLTIIQALVDCVACEGYGRVEVTDAAQRSKGAQEVECICRVNARNMLSLHGEPA